MAIYKGTCKRSSISLSVMHTSITSIHDRHIDMISMSRRRDDLFFTSLLPCSVGSPGKNPGYGTGGAALDVTSDTMDVTNWPAEVSRKDQNET